MLNVGENSYLTTEEADQYIFEHYKEFDDLRVVWTVLTEEEKETYLKNSLAEIERLPFIGRKYLFTQKLQFPRELLGYRSGLPPLYLAVYLGNGEIPDEVKAAQTENALGIINKEWSARADQQFKSANTLGIMKNIKYNRREFGEATLGEEITGQKNRNLLTSAVAESLLRKFTGSFRI